MRKKYSVCAEHTLSGWKDFRFDFSSFLKNFAFWSVTFFCMSAKATDILCPPMPVAVTERNRDVKSEIAASVIALGKVKGGDVGVKTEITAANLFAKYPNVDKLLALQTMSSTYCGLLKISAIPDKEKLDRWEKFTSRILELQVPSPVTSSRIPHLYPKAGKESQVKQRDLQPMSNPRPFRFYEAHVLSAENTKKVGQYMGDTGFDIKGVYTFSPGIFAVRIDSLRVEMKGWASADFILGIAPGCGDSRQPDFVAQTQVFSEAHDSGVYDNAYVTRNRQIDITINGGRSVTGLRLVALFRYPLYFSCAETGRL